MATIIQIRNAIETFVDNHRNAIQNRQNNFFSTHGHYWQGLLTHSILPDDGIEMAPDFLSKPTDQTLNWSDLGLTLPATFPCALKVDIYDGPLGKGFVLNVFASKAGTWYHRAYNFGPHTEFEQDWHSFEPRT